MQIFQKHVSSNIIFIALIFVSINVLASQDPQDRDLIFTNAFNNEKARIMTLPAYTLARDRFTQYLNEIEQYKTEKIREIHNDQEYQKNFATIKNEIQKSGTLYENLSTAERTHLIYTLTKRFILD